MLGARGLKEAAKKVRCTVWEALEIGCEWVAQRREGSICAGYTPGVVPEESKVRLAQSLDCKLLCERRAKVPKHVLVC